MQGFAGFVEAIKFAAFVEHRGFGRVEVFWGAAANHPTAKADAFAFDVADREHDAVAKTIVSFVIFLVDDHQAAFSQQRVVVFGEDAGQRAPAFGRVAQAKALGYLARQAAALEVVDGVRRDLELVAVGFTRFFEHIAQAVLLGFLGCRFGTVFGRLLFFGHHHAGLLGQVFHRFDEGHARVLHQEADGIAVFAAAKAVEKLFGGADAETGGFFAVKRAQAHEVGAAFLELHVLAHDVDHVDAGQQLLDERLGDGHKRAIFADKDGSLRAGFGANQHGFQRGVRQTVQHPTVSRNRTRS